MINRLLLALASLVIAGCNTSPVIVPDTTSDSPIVMKLKHDIMNGDKITTNWGWVLWYLPVLLLVMAWVWKEFVNKPIRIDDEEKAEESSQDPQQPAP
jgi:hypothetical protein